MPYKDLIDNAKFNLEILVLINSISLIVITAAALGFKNRILLIFTLLMQIFNGVHAFRAVFKRRK